MYIRRVKLTNWRNHSNCELFLQPGLNVMLGPNELGKSSVVEAIHKALYWDHTQRKQAGHSLDWIVPADNPTALPTVEVDLEMGDLQVGVTKVAAASKSQRQCVLKLKQLNSPERVLRGAEAEIELARLLSEDKSSPELHLARQGKSYDYLLQEALPGAACDALTVGQNGSVHASPRLGRIRQFLDQERAAKLAARLKWPPSDGARSGTEAARLRGMKCEKSERLGEAGRQLARVDRLRYEIGQCEHEIIALGPQVELARANLEKARELERQQMDAGRRKLEAKQAHDAISNQVRELDRRTQEIAAARSDIAQSSAQESELRERLASLVRQRAGLQSRQSAAQANVNKAEAAVESLGRRVDALTARQNFLALQEACGQSQRNVKRCELLHDQMAQAEKSLAALGKCPTGAQIGAWRKSHADLSDLKRDAATRLQVTIDLSKPATIEWRADGGSPSQTQVAPERPETVGAVRSLQLRIAEVGTIQVNCGASELVELVDEIDEKTSALDEALWAYGVTAGDLPDGFDRLEERRIAGESTARALHEAKECVREVERELGPLAQLRQTAAASAQQLLAAQAKYEALRALAPEGLDAAGVQAEIDSLMGQLASARHELGAAQLALESASRELSEVRTETARSEEAFSQVKSRLMELDRRLSELTADGLTDEQRAEQVHGLRVQLAAAQNELACAEHALTALGPAIVADEIAALERNLGALQQRLQEKRQRLAADRREVATICGDDPQGAIDQLKAEIAAIDSRLADEDRRLSALVLLQNVLNAEHQTLAKLIAGPLNDRISPWLRRLRGTDTTVVFDPEASRITNVITQTESGPREIPFEEHSEGLKGQVSLLIRLTLSREIARQTGSRQLVILDDPLTETSPDRRPEMFRILQQAAQDLQILFVTCHDDVLATLPGEAHIVAL